MRPLNAPRVSFAEVNNAAHQVWAYLYGVPWPAGWYVRVGMCSDRADGITRFSVNGYGGEIELKWVPDVLENLVHELVHVRGFLMHDAAFTAALEAARVKMDWTRRDPKQERWSRI